MTRYYDSPRWSGEIHDCSVPLTFDTYSRCSFDCQYCFAVNRKTLGTVGGQRRSALFQAREGGIQSVDVNRVMRMFLPPYPGQFGPFLRERRVLQWGGLADPFDQFERKFGVGLQLLRFFREIEYPITFSTKGAWWTEDPRYRECFEGYPWFHVKFSIISLDEAACRIVERGCPSPQERLRAMARAAEFVGGGVTLRFRPFILGLSDRDGGHLRLLEEAHRHGATSVSLEFLCVEVRSRYARTCRYPHISEVVGFDIEAFYRKHSRPGSGYYRLNRELKRPYVDAIQERCDQLGLRLYISDPHFKERSANGSCCGLPPHWPYSRGQLCEALVRARRTGYARWSDLEPHLGYARTFRWNSAIGFDTNNSRTRAKFWTFTMYDYLRYCWNHPEERGSPYRLFDGILVPSHLEGEDLVYRYAYELDRQRTGPSEPEETCPCGGPGYCVKGCGA